MSAEPEFEFEFDRQQRLRALQGQVTAVTSAWPKPGADLFGAMVGYYYASPDPQSVSSVGLGFISPNYQQQLEQAGSRLTHQLRVAGPESLSRYLEPRGYRIAGAQRADTGRAALSPLEQFQQDKVRYAKAVTQQLRNVNDRFTPHASRILDLVDAAAEEYPETDIPSPATITAFSQVLSRMPDMRPPELSLLSSGALWLSWRDAAYGSGGMAIFQDCTASFAMLLLNPQRPNRPEHFNVSGALDSVLRDMIGHASTRWIRTPQHGGG